jgi:urease accessory protein UreF
VKTLILNDDTYARMIGALSQTDEGTSLLRAFATPPELPSDRELVALSREPEAEPPEAVARAAAARVAGIQAAEDTRLAMNELLLHCHGAGVRPVVLSRWFGLKPTRVYEILDSA